MHKGMTQKPERRWVDLLVQRVRLPAHVIKESTEGQNGINGSLMCGITGVLLAVVGATTGLHLHRVAGAVFIIVGCACAFSSLIFLLRHSAIAEPLLPEPVRQCEAGDHVVGDRVTYVGGCRPVSTLNHLLKGDRLRVGDEGYVEAVEQGKDYPLKCRFPAARISLCAIDLLKVVAQPLEDLDMDDCEVLVPDGEKKCNGWRCCSVTPAAPPQPIHRDPESGPPPKKFVAVLKPIPPRPSAYNWGIPDPQAGIEVEAREALVRPLRPAVLGGVGATWQMRRAVALLLHGAKEKGTATVSLPDDLWILISQHVGSYHHRELPENPEHRHPRIPRYITMHCGSASDMPEYQIGQQWRWDPWARLLTDPVVSPKRQFSCCPCFGRGSSRAQVTPM
eukprot:Hpha_TRINITY_DN14684_c1_g1::TRINITY_DN14684_c1_g1_i1::g.47883::m.47883